MAFCKLSLSGEERLICTHGSGCPLVSSAATSSGTSRCVDPGFSACAVLKTFLTISGVPDAFSKRAFHLVMGLKSSSMSMN